MKIKDFIYQKDTGASQYSLVVVKESLDSFEGFNIKDLSKEEQEKIQEVFKTFEAGLAPYMSKYRKFSKNKILKVITETTV